MVFRPIPRLQGTNAVVLEFSVATNTTLFKKLSHDDKHRKDGV